MVVCHSLDFSSHSYESPKYVSGKNPLVALSGVLFVPGTGTQTDGSVRLKAPLERIGAIDRWLGILPPHNLIHAVSVEWEVEAEPPHR